jgi:hypothetical protein
MVFITRNKFRAGSLYSVWGSTSILYGSAVMYAVPSCQIFGNYKVNSVS